MNTETPALSLYESAIAAGIPHSSHESDLYLPDCVAVRAILDRYPLDKANARPFRSQIDGRQWLDIPFAFLPWWEKRAAERRPLRIRANSVS